MKYRVFHFLFFFLFNFPADFLHDLGKMWWGWFCTGSQWAIFYREMRTETASLLYLLSLHLQKEANNVLLPPPWGTANLNHLLFAKILVSKICRLPLLVSAGTLKNKGCALGVGYPAEGNITLTEENYSYAAWSKLAERKRNLFFGLYSSV